MREAPLTSLLALTFAGVLAGCSFTPRYERPDLPVAQDWPQDLQAAAGEPALGEDAEKTLRWEEFYRSAPLREVIRLGLENNRDLRQAVLNVQAYRARYRIQHADLFPTLEAGADGSLQRLPADVSQTGQGHVFEQYGLDVGTTSYELDLFGRIRSLNSEAMQTYLASEQARRASQITLVANIAIAFLTLEIDRQRLDLSQRTLTNYEEALGLVERGLEVGTATELDRRQAATLVAQTQAEVQRGTRLVATDTNALRLLVGTALPEGFDSGFIADDTILARVPAGLPAALLQRRPDIMEAEHQLMAANADIGAARAAFFPQVTLTGAGGTVSDGVSGLFGHGQGTWSFLPHISLPIFTGGRLKGNLRYAELTRDMRVAAYEKSIQTAFREVSDGLAARVTFGRQLAAQQREVASSQGYLDLADKAYRGGVRDYLVVLDAQRTVFSAQQQYLVDHLAQLTGEIQLYQALGGGWSPQDDATSL